MSRLLGSILLFLFHLFYNFDLSINFSVKSFHLQGWNFTLSFSMTLSSIPRAKHLFIHRFPSSLPGFILFFLNFGKMWILIRFVNVFQLTREADFESLLTYRSVGDSNPFVLFFQLFLLDHVQKVLTVIHRILFVNVKIYSWVDFSFKRRLH
jgi:hypothetical protein